MYYRVLEDSINYRDQMGVAKRASAKSIIYLEQRSEVKRLLKEGKIERIPDDSVVATDRDFVLKSETLPEEKTSKRKEEKEVKKSKTIQVGDLVEGKVEDQTLIGEVISTLKSGKLKIRFSEDTKQYRQMDESDLEIIG